jgi:hypothetical protein
VAGAWRTGFRAGIRARPGHAAPPTIRQTIEYLLSGPQSKTVADLAAWADTRPQRIRPGLYHWRFAGRTLLTYTTRTAAGEEITCWGMVK